MAAGAIPPPLFFERRRLREQISSVHGILKNTPDNISASITRLEHSGEMSLARRDRSPSKDI
jgi:hypothetical protein